jgi:hypothetical protein
MTTLRVDWAAAPAGQMVTSYNVYMTYNGTASVANVPTNTYSIDNPSTGSYAFQVSALNLAGEGGKSNVAFGPTVPSAPNTPVITVSSSL